MKGDLNFEGEEWSYVSPQSKHLVRNMLNKNPILRLDTASAMQHEWFQMQRSENSKPEIYRDVLVRIKEHQTRNLL